MLPQLHTPYPKERPRFASETSLPNNPETARALFTGPTNRCDHSPTDEAIACYVRRFQVCTRLLLAGTLTLPLLGLGLPFVVAGWRQRSALLRLIAQIGIDEKEWIHYVAQCLPTFPFEHDALKASAAALSAAVVLVFGIGLTRASVRVAAANFLQCVTLAPSSLPKSSHLPPARAARFDIVRSLTQ